MTNGEHRTNQLFRLSARDGAFEIEVAGAPAALMRLEDRLRRDAPAGLDSSELYEWVLRQAAVDDVTVVIHRAVPTSQSRDLARMIKAIQHSSTAERAFIRLLALFEIAGETEVNELLRSPDLVVVREYIGSVVEDLDERAGEARRELNAVLPPAAAYLLVPEPL